MYVLNASLFHSMKGDTPMYVYVAFDIEDLVHPDSDDIVLDIAEMLSKEGLTGCMCVVGEKARLWEQRKRQDVIDAVKKHDVGYHTDHHSVHPTVSEYLADKEWEDGVEEALKQERPGLNDLVRIFDTFPSTWGTGGSGWGPQIAAASRILKIPSQIYPQVDSGTTGACWYGGVLCYYDSLHLEGVEGTCCDASAFESALPGLLCRAEQARDKGYACMRLFGAHPTKLRYTEFWDKLNFYHGKNTSAEDYVYSPRRSDGEYTTGLNNIIRMIKAVREINGVDVTTLRELNKLFVPPEVTLTKQEILNTARAAAHRQDIPDDDPLTTPAQRLYIMTQAVVETAEKGSSPESVYSKDLLGPEDNPPAMENEKPVPFEKAVRIFKHVVEYADSSGHIPAIVSADGFYAGPGSLLRAAAQTVLDLDRGGEIETVTFLPGCEHTHSADRLEQRIRKNIPEWVPHDPEMNMDLLVKHTRLQTWSMKPAMIKG